MKIKKGDVIRLKTRTIGGWKGIGIAVEDQQGDTVQFRKNGDPNDGLHDDCYACRWEVVRVRRTRSRPRLS